MILEVIGGWRYYTEKTSYLSAERYWYVDRRDSLSTYMAVSKKEEAYFRRELRPDGFALKTVGGTNSYQSEGYVHTGPAQPQATHDERDDHSWYLWIASNANDAAVFTEDWATIDGTHGYRLKTNIDGEPFYVVAGQYYHTDHRARYSTFLFCNDTMGPDAGTLFRTNFALEDVELEATPMQSFSFATLASVSVAVCVVMMLVVVKIVRTSAPESMVEPLLEA